MTSDFRYSVVIPAHNAGRWLRRGIDSVLAQTCGASEIIVVDDHSTDDTAVIAASYLSAVRVHHSTVRGSNPARNLGLRNARAEWIQFLDADDYLLPDHVARQRAALAQCPNADALYSPSLLVPVDGEPSPSAPLSGADDPIQAFLSNYGFQTGAVLWRRSALLGIGGWNETVPRAQDYEVVLRALRAGLGMKWNPHAGAAYCLHAGDSVSRSQPIATLRANFALVVECCRWLRETSRFTPVYAQLAHRRLLQILWSISASEPRWAEEQFGRAFAQGLVRPRWFSSRIEAAIRLCGWRGAVALHRAVSRLRR